MATLSEQRWTAAGLVAALTRLERTAGTRERCVVNVCVARFANEVDGTVRHESVETAGMETTRRARIFVVRQAVRRNIHDAAMRIHCVAVGPVTDGDERVGRKADFISGRKRYA